MIWQWNEKLFLWMHGLAGWSWSTDWLIIFVGHYLPYLIALHFIYLIWRKKNKRERLSFAFFSSFSVFVLWGVLVSFLHYFFPILRPSVTYKLEPLITETGMTFPSEHAVVFMILAILTLFVERKYFSWYVAGAVIIGLARVIAGIHYPLDILVGWGIGLLPLTFSSYFLRRR